MHRLAQHICSITLLSNRKCLVSECPVILQFVIQRDFLVLSCDIDLSQLLFPYHQSLVIMMHRPGKEGVMWESDFMS